MREKGESTIKGKKKVVLTGNTPNTEKKPPRKGKRDKTKLRQKNKGGKYRVMRGFSKAHQERRPLGLWGASLSSKGLVFIHYGGYRRKG